MVNLQNRVIYKKLKKLEGSHFIARWIDVDVKNRKEIYRTCPGEIRSVQIKSENGSTEIFFRTAWGREIPLNVNYDNFVPDDEEDEVTVYNKELKEPYRIVRILSQYDKMYPHGLDIYSSEEEEKGMKAELGEFFRKNDTVGHREA